MKRLIIISGITGAIGSSLLAEYGQSNENIIYGISRRALPVSRYLQNKKLPLKTLICKLSVENEFEEFFDSINYSEIKEIVYIHAIGLYPFEVNKDGKIVIENDVDGDGINDKTFGLTYTSFVNAVTSLTSHWKGKMTALVFGAISDVHEPEVHQSWWRTMKLVKSFMKKSVETNPLMTMIVFNTSSVLCPHEIITRPYVFIHTDADQTKWMHPQELARFVVSSVEKVNPGFHETDKFRPKENFDSEEYYSDKSFTPRKVEELF